MGFCSWKTSDTNESLSNCYSDRGALPVKMLLPDGTVIIEKDYGGYGDFGQDCVDFYEMVHVLTEGLFYGDGDREQGIKIWFANYYGGEYDGYKLEKKMIAPKIVSINCTQSYDELPDSPDCEHQGFFYDDIEITEVLS